jgi:hypothetical protein
MAPKALEHSQPKPQGAGTTGEGVTEVTPAAYPRTKAGTYVIIL